MQQESGTKPDFDYIIVGAGIAGCVLSYEMLRRGLRVLLVDDPSFSSASRIAAGVYNPVVLKRITLSWKAAELCPLVETFYPAMERFFAGSFFFPARLRRLFSGSEELELWNSRRRLFPAFMSEAVAGPVPAFNQIHGEGAVLHAGYVDTRSMIGLVRAYFKSAGCFREEKVLHDSIITCERVSWKNVTARGMVFCEGPAMRHNPWFRHLPLRPTKGEVLIIRTKEPVCSKEEILHKGFFMVPLEDQHYKVGATFAWNDLTDAPTPAGKKELVDLLLKHLAIPFEVVDHRAGVRPATADRRPIIGRHPSVHGISVLNGLGSRGLMMAPYLAGQLVDHLENGLPLEREIAIERFA